MSVRKRWPAAEPKMPEGHRLAWVCDDGVMRDICDMNRDQLRDALARSMNDLFRLRERGLSISLFGRQMS